MRTILIENDFAEWRARARQLLREQIPPAEVLWEHRAGDSLFGEGPAAPPSRSLAPTAAPRVRPEFLELARTVGHHASPDRWALLYRVLWRLTLGGERHLLRVASDPDVSSLQAMRKAVGRDVHKMHAFVRFKKVGEDPESGREQFVAWFEPEHRIMSLAAGFFRKRFAGMDWSIFTPTGSAHWDGETLRHGPGVESMEAPDDVELEELWRSYYKSIFNPARVKVKAMLAEMPKKYWKNLPEAGLIEGLVAGGGARLAGMLEEEERPARDLANNSYLQRLRELSGTAGEITRPEDFVGRDLATLRTAASGCRACPLCEAATGTVFGEGSVAAEIMIVGEQPGDQEDLAGRPFVGPAGQVLDTALAEAGIERGEVYLTNAVKHFKWKRDGKRRLHQSPSAGEVTTCRPWVVAELLEVRPRVLICLGSTAAQSLIDPAFRITRQRGLVDRPDLAPRVVATVHPSHLLRLRDQGRTVIEREAFVNDLRLARDS